MQSVENISSLEVRVLCQGGGQGAGGHAHAQSDVTSAQSGHIRTQKKFLSPLIGKEFKMANGKQPSDWTIIQDGRWACDWTRMKAAKVPSCIVYSDTLS